MTYPENEFEATKAALCLMRIIAAHCRGKLATGSLRPDASIQETQAAAHLDGCLKRHREECAAWRKMQKKMKIQDEQTEGHRLAISLGPLIDSHCRGEMVTDSLPGDASSFEKDAAARLDEYLAGIWRAVDALQKSSEADMEGLRKASQNAVEASRRQVEMLAVQGLDADDRTAPPSANKEGQR